MASQGEVGKLLLVVLGACIVACLLPSDSPVSSARLIENLKLMIFYFCDGESFIFDLIL